MLTEALPLRFGRPIASSIALFRGVRLIERVLEPGFHLNPAIHSDAEILIGGVLAPMAGASICPSNEVRGTEVRGAKPARKFGKSNGRSAHAQSR
jgi:hypothetical protein